MTDPAWLAGVEWNAKTPSDEDVSSGLPYATHSGVWTDPLFGLAMRCYRLSDGRAIIHADDLDVFMGKFLAEEG